jgi:hypothetical protein
MFSLWDLEIASTECTGSAHLPSWFSLRRGTSSNKNQVIKFVMLTLFRLMCPSHEQLVQYKMSDTLFVTLVAMLNRNTKYKIQNVKCKTIIILFKMLMYYMSRLEPKRRRHDEDFQLKEQVSWTWELDWNKPSFGSLVLIEGILTNHILEVKIHL